MAFCGALLGRGRTSEAVLAPLSKLAATVSRTAHFERLVEVLERSEGGSKSDAPAEMLVLREGGDRRPSVLLACLVAAV